MAEQPSALWHARAANITSDLTVCVCRRFSLLWPVCSFYFVIAVVVVVSAPATYLGRAICFDGDGDGKGEA